MTLKYVCKQHTLWSVDTALRCFPLTRIYQALSLHLAPDPDCSAPLSTSLLWCQNSSILDSQMVTWWFPLRILPSVWIPRNWLPKFICPFEIEKMTNPAAERLKPHRAMRNNPTRHVSKVKPCSLSSGSCCSTTTDSPYRSLVESNKD